MMKTVKLLEKSSILLKVISSTIKCETNKQRSGSFWFAVK